MRKKATILPFIGLIAFLALTGFGCGTSSDTSTDLDLYDTYSDDTYSDDAYDYDDGDDYIEYDTVVGFACDEDFDCYDVELDILANEPTTMYLPDGDIEDLYYVDCDEDNVCTAEDYYGTVWVLEF